MMKKKHCLMACLIFLLTTLPITLLQGANDGIPLPRKSDVPSSPPLASQKTPTPSETAPFREIPELQIECLAFRVVMKKDYKFGVEWDKDSLEGILGKPLAGQFQPSSKDKKKLNLETLIIADPEKFLKYLSQFGEAKLLYKQTWSQAIGEHVSRELQSTLPYTTSFASTDSSASQPQAYTQSSVRAGMTIGVTLSGVQYSSESPSVDIMFEIEMKDAYKTKDNLYALNSIISADSTTIPLSQSLIQSNLFSQGDVSNQYIFILTPRDVK
jgi:hypothetical protein